MTLLSMTRGDRQAFAIAITDSDAAPVNLTGIGVTFTAKRRPTDLDADAVIQKSTSAGGVEIDADPTTGLATLTIEASDTAGLTFTRSLYWDIQIDDGEGDVRTPLSGLLSIATDQTRSSGAS